MQVTKFPLVQKMLSVKLKTLPLVKFLLLAPMPSTVASFTAWRVACKQKSPIFLLVEMVCTFTM